MAKYAKIAENLTVSEWVEIDDPSVIPQHKAWSDGGLHFRPVIDSEKPKARAELADVVRTIKVGADVVKIIFDVVPKPRDQQRQAVKSAARNIILTRFPEWKQQNMTARSVELLQKRLGGEWTDDEQKEADAMRAAWDWIKAVRTASDELERLEPIPEDFDDPAWWPA